MQRIEEKLQKQDEKAHWNLNKNGEFATRKNKYWTTQAMKRHRPINESFLIK